MDSFTKQKYNFKTDENLNLNPFLSKLCIQEVILIDLDSTIFSKIQKYVTEIQS